MITDDKENYCKILGYVLNNDDIKNKRSTFSTTNNSWYLLHIEQTLVGDSFYHDIKRYPVRRLAAPQDCKYDTRHPGFFYPAVEINRRYKLDSLLDV